MVCQGHRGSVYDSDSEADQSTMELVGYHTSQKEIRDVYQSIYLLWRAPGLPPCRTQPRRKAIQDILSSLKCWLHRHGHSATTRDWKPQEEEQVRLNQWGSYEEALRVAHQRAWIPPRLLRVILKGWVEEDAAAALEGEIDRLSCPLSQSWPEVRVRLKSRDCQMQGARECKRRHCQVQFTNNPAPCHPPQESPESGEGEATAEDLELGGTARVGARGYLLL